MSCCKHGLPTTINEAHLEVMRCRRNLALAVMGQIQNSWIGASFTVEAVAYLESLIPDLFALVGDDVGHARCPRLVIRFEVLEGKE